MTVMVRDEADIIGPMIEHHLAQGIDRIIVTDNGSKDGTTEILESFGSAIDLRHDPVHRKQQFSVVTGMARDAYTRYGADWVVNADADEFWFPRAGAAASLAETFAALDPALTTFTVPVIDMTGDPAATGSGLQRLTVRDLRPVERLRRIGLRDHSTPDAVHIGSADVEVAQGNHFVNLKGAGSVPDGLALEVLHFPWRSWSQFATKVENAGRAYEANPDLLPSPNHHGMREYARLKAGTLFAYYVLRHPDAEETARGLESGELVRDDRVSLSAVSPVPDSPLDAAELRAAAEYGPVIAGLDIRAAEAADAARGREAELLGYVDEGKQRIDGLLADVQERDSRIAELAHELDLERNRKVIKAMNWIDRRVRRPL
ncbi:glycosyltransferase family 2 protein [Leifsonia shinshuensis]|uniref:Glycosyltransferase family 2 protein n=1 Tax=Leifsonia shinshuensis TaxID=150026 RepID=A0A7G6Y9C6_9MICO|nr:glycosyltransferase family 2 protein [Leifsonia shinshuensis]QNE35091.1 glycosyltransferase family 2 protein [Leifsonia shinshuensis]